MSSNNNIVCYLLACLAFIISNSSHAECKRWVPVRVGNIHISVPVWPGGVNSEAAVSMISNLSPPDGEMQYASETTVEGCVGEKYKTLFVNDIPVNIKTDKSFSTNVNLINGNNFVSFLAGDSNGDIFRDPVFTLVDDPGTTVIKYKQVPLSGGGFVTVEERLVGIYANIYDGNNQLIYPDILIDSLGEDFEIASYEDRFVIVFRRYYSGTNSEVMFREITKDNLTVRSGLVPSSGIPARNPMVDIKMGKIAFIWEEKATPSTWAAFASMYDFPEYTNSTGKVPIVSDAVSKSISITGSNSFAALIGTSSGIIGATFSDNDFYPEVYLGVKVCETNEPAQVILSSIYASNVIVRCNDKFKLFEYGGPVGYFFADTVSYSLTSNSANDTYYSHYISGMNNGFMLTYNSLHNSGADIRGKYFDALGNEIGTEFVTNSSYLPSIFPDYCCSQISNTTDGLALISWNGEGIDVNGQHGIVNQIFDRPLIVNYPTMLPFP